MGGREQDGDRDWDTGHRGDGIDLLHLNRWMSVYACFIGDGVDKLAAAVATVSGTCCAQTSHPARVPELSDDHVKAPLSSTPAGPVVPL